MPSAPTHRKRALDELACVHPNAAALDIGSEEIVVAVPPDRDPEPVRVFQTFTADLQALVAWLVACGIDTVAMESTGVFWIPIYELLEAAGIVPYLVNARHVKGESNSKNAMSFNARAQLARVIGVDLVAVMGLSAITVQTIISEIGTDMERFPRVKHFCSWLGLAPHNDISGGKVLRSRTMNVHSRANQAFRQAAHSVTRAHSSIGAYYRAMRARLGPKQAIVATAHKIARIVYHLLKTGEPYREESDAEYERKRQEREIKHLARRAQKLGYTLTAVPATAPETHPEPGGEGSF